MEFKIFKYTSIVLLVTIVLFITVATIFKTEDATLAFMMALTASSVIVGNVLKIIDRENVSKKKKNTFE